MSKIKDYLMDLEEVQHEFSSEEIEEQIMVSPEPGEDDGQPF